MRATLYRDAALADGRSERLRLPVSVLVEDGRITRLRPSGDEGELPPGTDVTPAIWLAHTRPQDFPDPYAFRPERFLDHPPSTYTWIPFGGGVRRCIGAGFAMMEGVAVLREVFRAVDVTAAGTDEPKVRNITSVPKYGARIKVNRRR